MADILGNALGSAESVTKFAPDRFRAQFEVGLGYASPNRFEVELPDIAFMTKVDGSSTKDTSDKEMRNMLCTAMNMPGKTIQTVDRQIGIQKTAVAVGHSMPNVTLTFYLTNTYSMKNYFDEWHQCVTSQDENGAMNVGYYRNYIKDIVLKQYTRNARRSYEITLIDAYPVAVNQIELSNQPQSQIAEVTVEIAYRTFVTERTKSGLGGLGGLFG